MGDFESLLRSLTAASAALADLGGEVLGIGS